ncbi:signal peptidase I [Chloroflexota bacterium]
MKRTLALLAIIAICMAAFLSIRGAMPFMAVFGTSMEPELHAGDLILIDKVLSSDVKEGDIIVYSVPSSIREYYNYPAVVAHRVIKIVTRGDELGFRTKGDNTGEDPFTIRPQDLLGQVSKQIPSLGLPLLFFQSQQGLIFVIVALSLIAIYLFADEISRSRKKIHKGIFAPVIQESQHTSEVLEQRMESAEKGAEYTQQALNSFAQAMAEYAQHLQSHTSAIQGLSEASHELKRGAAEQNRVLARLLETIEQPGPKKEATEPVEQTSAGTEVEEAPKAEEIKYPPGCFRSRRRANEEENSTRQG